MGGNAMAEFGAQRVDYDRYCELKLKLFDYFECDMNFMPHVHEKETFGDIDVVIDFKHREDIMHKIHVDKLPNKVNGNVVSFLFEEVQVDLIFHHPVDIPFAVNYFSYNDLGNLIGRIAHKMGMKFGHDGLWLPVRDGDNKLGDILLTKNFYEAISFLGFSVLCFHNGFDTFEDMFNYVVNSKYFNRDLYPLEHRNHTARVRDRKRKTYMAFLEWLDKNSDRDFGDFEFSSNKNHYLDHIFDNFGVGVRDSFVQLHRDNAVRKYVKSLYPMQRIGELLNIEGKELGAFIKYIKSIVNWEIVVLIEDVDTIDENLVRIYGEWVTTRE